MRRWWIPLFWCAFAFMSATQTFLAMLTHGHSFARIVFYQLAVWAGWIVLTPMVIRLVERFPPRRWRNIAAHTGVLVLSDGTQLRLSRARREEFERRLAGR